MNTFIIEPLFSEHEVIQIRTTNLERFWTCPLNYNKVVPEYSTEAFEFGKVVHNAIQSYLFAPEKREEILDFIKLYKQDYYEPIKSYMNLVKFNILENWYIPIVNEIEWTMEIHCGKYKFVITWTADLVMRKEWLEWYIIWDLKTSKAEWKEENVKKKLQKYIYSYMLGLKIGFDKVFGFEYYVLTKHKSPRFQNIWLYNMKQEQIENIIASIILSYVEALESDEWIPIKNSYCFFCPLSKNKQCPEFWWINFNL